jgi:sulfate adenylyltransferase
MTVEEISVRLDAKACDAHELFAWGALEPLNGYLSQRDHRAVLSTGRLADGTPWRWPWTLRIDNDPGPTDVTLVEPEGQRLGRVKVEESWRHEDSLLLSGPVSLDGQPITGAFRNLRRPPSAVSGGRVGLLVDGPLEPDAVLGAMEMAESSDSPLLLMPVVGGSEVGHDSNSVAAVRSSRSAKTRLGDGVEVAGLPLPSTWWRSPAESWLAAKVAKRFGVDTLLVPDHARATPYDDSTARMLRCPRSGRMDESLRLGLNAVREASSPSADRAGLVVLFTGLPSAGKSTLARGLRDLLLSSTARTVTLWDGDIVRSTLSQDLSFSRADRLRNLTRLATVSAECARHGGVVLCAPIAPHEQGRDVFRRTVSQVANMVLVYVATPLAECMRRDPKGLYAGAVAGRVSNLTGVDDPYEVPRDPDLVVGERGESPDAAARTVLAELVRRGWIHQAPWESA